jgi:hypothetical protein
LTHAAIHEQLLKHVKRMRCTIAELWQNSDSISEFGDNILRIQSFELCTRDTNTTNAEFESCEIFFQHQDEDFTAFVKEQFGGINELLRLEDCGKFKL